mgnify:CR=1 FL=1
MHTASLVVMGYEDSSGASSATAVSDSEDLARPPRENDDQVIQLSELEDGQHQLRQTSSGQKKKTKRRLSLSEVRKKRQAAAEANAGRREVPVAVVEQRVSNLAQGSLCKSGLTSGRLSQNHAHVRPCPDDQAF